MVMTYLRASGERDNMDALAKERPPIGEDTRRISLSEFFLKSDAYISFCRIYIRTLLDDFKVDHVLVPICHTNQGEAQRQQITYHLHHHHSHLHHTHTAVQMNILRDP